MKNETISPEAETAPKVSSRSHIGERVPKLRFPGFEGEWECHTLKELVTRITRKNGIESDIPLTISAQHGLIDQRTFFSKSVASADMSGYYLLKRGEFAYNRSSSNEYPFGSIKRLEKYDKGAVSTLYLCFAVRDGVVDCEFLKYYLDSPKWHKSVGMICAEGARNHGLLNVPTDGFFDTEHYISGEHNEQTHIADFVALIDARIAAQRRFVELLKKHKRGLLREIFEECAEGDRRAFCEIATRRTEKISPTNDSALDCIELEHIETDTGLVLGSVPLREQNSLKNRCRPNDIIFGKLRPYLRKFVFAESECAVSSETWVLTAASGVNPRFLFYLIQSEPFMRVANISSGTKMPRSEWPNIANAQFAIPYQSRQQTIAECFILLDKRIQDAQKTFLSMQTYKRGLFQQLFV